VFYLVCAFIGAISPAFPVVSDHYESNVPGLYIIGALAGYPLIKQCMNQGYEVVEYILGNPVAPADEPLIQAKLDAAQPGLVVSPFIATIREQVPVFAELSPLQIREFLLTSEVHLAAPGQKIFERNDYTNSFYAIIDGSVEVLIGEAGAPANPVLRGGEFFGEIGLLSGRRRGATVIARDGALLLEVPRNTMLRLQRSELQKTDQQQQEHHHDHAEQQQQQQEIQQKVQFPELQNIDQQQQPM
jgi:hypothetical protein